jgi:hypothetical protein
VVTTQGYAVAKDRRTAATKALDMCMTNLGAAAHPHSCELVESGCGEGGRQKDQ